MKKIVIFGGGSGLSQLLKGIKLFPVNNSIVELVEEVIPSRTKTFFIVKNKILTSNPKEI